MSREGHVDFAVDIVQFLLGFAVEILQVARCHIFCYRYCLVFDTPYDNLRFRCENSTSSKESYTWLWIMPSKGDLKI